MVMRAIYMEQRDCSGWISVDFSKRIYKWWETQQLLEPPMCSPPFALLLNCFFSLDLYISLSVPPSFRSRVLFRASLPAYVSLCPSVSLSLPLSAFISLSVFSYMCACLLSAFASLPHFPFVPLSLSLSTCACFRASCVSLHQLRRAPLLLSRFRLFLMLSDRLSLLCAPA